jgi:serine/threonine protein kinase/tetratricopeptide (TPR) repeat protein
MSLGHYRILRHLGSGGMGEVYAAEDTRLKREVALKLLPADLAADAARRQRFQREVEAVAALDHPHIVTIYSVESAGSAHFFTMQLVDGRTLDRLIPQGGLPFAEFLDIAVPLADALRSAHGKGITHRDLKPGNIMVDRDGRVRLLDFGLAKLAVPAAPQQAVDETRTVAALTQETSLVGTVPYMSPEQIKGLPVDPRSDIFSFGSILYEMVVGRRPFTGESRAELMSAVLRDTPVAVTRFRSDYPQTVDSVVERCLQKEPAARYDSATALHRDLDALRHPSTLQTVPAGAHLDLPSRPSLAVLPFENVGGDPDQEYFAQGLWTDINADLVKISNLFLVSQLSTGLYKDKPVLPPQIGRELGVRYILQGTVRRGGERIRITMQLVDTHTGEQVWAERYDGELGDLFTFQDRITAEIVETLDVKLVRGEGHRIVGRSIKSPQARDTFYRALAALFSLKPEDLAAARDLLCHAEELEPDSPLMHVFAAEAFYFEATLGYADREDEALDRAMAAADRAIELDDPTGVAHLLQGIIQLRRQQHDAALASSDQAFGKRPSCPWAYALQGAVHNYAGRPSEGLGKARLAIRHTPLAPPVFPAVLATSYYLLEQYDHAMDAARSILAVAPETLEASVLLAAALAAAGRASEAGPVVKDIFRMNAGFTLDDFARSQPYEDPVTLSGLLDNLRSAGVS